MAAQLEMQHGKPSQVESLLKRAVQACPQAEVLWLMAPTLHQQPNQGNEGGEHYVLLSQDYVLHRPHGRCSVCQDMLLFTLLPSLH